MSNWLDQLSSTLKKNITQITPLVTEDQPVVDEPLFDRMQVSVLTLDQGTLCRVSVSKLRNKRGVLLITCLVLHVFEGSNIIVGGDLNICMSQLECDHHAIKIKTIGNIIIML